MSVINWKTYNLEDLKKDKLAELNKRCNDTILGRFSSEVNGVFFYFSHDSEAQSNFSMAKLAFMDSTVEKMGGTINWTAYDSDGKVCRLQLNKAQFDSVFLSKMQHVNSNVAKYRDFLMPLVNQAASKEEVEGVVW